MAGKSYTSKRILPIELIYYEAFKSKMDAQNREQHLKQYGNALGHLKKRISRSLYEKGGSKSAGEWYKSEK